MRIMRLYGGKEVNGETRVPKMERKRERKREVFEGVSVGSEEAKGFREFKETWGRRKV